MNRADWIANNLEEPRPRSFSLTAKILEVIEHDHASYIHLWPETRMIAIEDFIESLPGWIEPESRKTVMSFKDAQDPV